MTGAERSSRRSDIVPMTSLPSQVEEPPPAYTPTAESSVGGNQLGVERQQPERTSQMSVRERQSGQTTTVSETTNKRICIGCGLLTCICCVGGVATFFAAPGGARAAGLAGMACGTVASAVTYKANQERQRRS